MNTGPTGVRAFDPAAGRFTGPLLTRPAPPHGAFGGRLYRYSVPIPEPSATLWALALTAFAVSNRRKRKGRR